MKHCLVALWNLERKTITHQSMLTSCLLSGVICSYMHYEYALNSHHFNLVMLLVPFCCNETFNAYSNYDFYCFYYPQ